MGKYDDIINLSRPESKHPKMSLSVNLAVSFTCPS